jgi:hypothetical protein
MSHLFISYARENQDAAAELASLLEAKGYSVWWDPNLIGGTDFREAIRQQLLLARKVLVLWSRQSVQSGFVIDEASEAKRLQKLIPICIDECSPPLGFGDLHTLSASSLRRDISGIVNAIEDKSAPKSAHSRPLATQFLSDASVAAAVVIAAVGGVCFALAMHLFFLLGLLVLLYVGLAAGLVLAAADRRSLGAAFRNALYPAVAVPLAYVFYLAARIAANFLGNYSSPTVLAIPGGSGSMLTIDDNKLHIAAIIGSMSLIAFIVTYVLVALFSICLYPLLSGVANQRTRIGVSLFCGLILIPAAFLAGARYLLL